MADKYTLYKRNLVFTALVLLLSLQGSIAQKQWTEKAGDVGQYLIPATALMSTLVYRDGSKPAWQFGKAFALSMVTTHSLKRIINKERPNGGNYGFPSGHTAAAFTGAAFIERRYGWTYGIPAYMLAGFVAWSRVEADKHDWVDVSSGALIGVASAYLFTTSFKPLKDKADISVGLGTVSVVFYF